MSSRLIIRTSLLVLAILWLGFFSFRAIGQSQEEFNRLRNRFEDWEKGQQVFAINIESRLVRLETNLAHLSTLIYGITGAVGLQLLSGVGGVLLRAHRVHRRQKSP